MRELVEYLAKALVDDPEGVKVSAVEGRKHAVLEIIE